MHDILFLISIEIFSIEYQAKSIRYRDCEYQDRRQDIWLNLVSPCPDTCV